MTFSKFEQQAQDALRFIGSGVDWSKLLKHMRCHTHELEKLVGTLKDRGDIEERFEATGGRSRRIIKRTIEGSARVAAREESGKKWEESREESPNGRVAHLTPVPTVGK